MTRRHHLPSKRKSYPVVMMGLVLTCSLCLSLPVPAALNMASSKHEQAMLWPLLPGESVNSLAEKLYPQSPVLQQRFVQQSITLSRSRGIDLQPDARSETAQLIAVPNAQTLHTLTHRIKKADEVTTVPVATPGLMMSVQLTQPTPTSAGWSLPKPSFPSLRLPALPLLHEYSFSRTHLNRRVTALKTHIVDTYTANTQAIARTPVKRLYQTPQLALIILSAMLLLVLSLVWGVLEEWRNKR